MLYCCFVYVHVTDFCPTYDSKWRPSIVHQSVAVGKFFSCRIIVTCTWFSNSFLAEKCLVIFVGWASLGTNQEQPIKNQFLASLNRTQFLFSLEIFRRFCNYLSRSSSNLACLKSYPAKLDMKLRNRSRMIPTKECSKIS